MKYSTVLIIMGVMFLQGCKTENYVDKTTVKNVDINKYLGKWYEIARYEHYFEKDLEGVTAN